VESGLGVDPWHDYLALPVAPFILLAQLIALFIRPRWVRLAFAFGCTAAIALMLAYVASLETPASDGVNIGEPLLALWLGLSIVLLVIEVAREGIAAVWRRLRPARSATSRV
jgi:hypothetical protein